ncbi:MAG: hypothetical protein K6E75_13330 [Lachnospiraceae bacterium]|nr:hypothetical protein [Lachnospiraceae bacterium]
MRQRFEIHKRKDGRWYARYQRELKPDGKSGYSYVYGKTKEEVEARLKEIELENLHMSSPKELNLLILGAGTHGRDVKEIAESLHVFRKIRFLDDKVIGEDILGKCEEVSNFRKEYPCAFIAIGDNKVREKYAKLIIKQRFLIPTLVAPSAFISSHAKIGEGTVVMPQTNLGAVNVKSFCIVAAGCTIGSDVELSDYTRVDSGAIVPKSEYVPEGTWIRSGEIYQSKSNTIGDVI